MITDYVCIKDGVVVNVDVNISITMDKLYRKFEDELRVKISNRIDAFFSINRWEYGKTLKENDLIKEFSDLKEIKSVDITFNTDDITLGATNIVTTKFYEIIRSDIIELGFVYE